MIYSRPMTYREQRSAEVREQIRLVLVGWDAEYDFYPTWADLAEVLNEKGLVTPLHRAWTEGNICKYMNSVGLQPKDFIVKSYQERGHEQGQARDRKQSRNVDIDGSGWEQQKRLQREQREREREQREEEEKRAAMPLPWVKKG